MKKIFDHITYRQQVDGDSDLVESTKTLEQHLWIISMFEDLPVVMLQEFELRHDGAQWKLRTEEELQMSYHRQRGDLTTSTSNI